MKQTSTVLVKNPTLNPAEDFYRLRRDGISFIAQMGSRQWTDYNVHDAGITIHEALCYAITDIAYRIGWSIEDILAPKIPSADPQPYPNQAFFTARQILTVSPLKPDDFRRLLIDLPSVRNAWVLCKECACDASYFAYCVNDALTLSYTRPDASLKPVEISPQGLYEVLLELEADPECGDLNDRKIEERIVFHDADGAHMVILEWRFPDISLSSRDQWQLLLGSDPIAGIALKRFGATKDFDLFTAFTSDADRDNYVRNNRRNIFYATFQIDLTPPHGSIIIENAALRLIGDVTAMKAPIARGLISTLMDVGLSGLVQRYRDKEKLALKAVQSAKESLHQHRNLDEDYCLIKTVAIEEVAVCADVEVKPDADIEHVQAQIWFEIEDYFDPAISFHTLEELRNAGEAVEDIFDGPELSAGFLKANELSDASLKTNLRVSDILDRLMAIPGIIAVNKLLLTKYDSEGNPVAGAADPTWLQGKPVFKPNKVSASWQLFISNRHQPRLYLNMSRFLFYKNGLLFLPRMDEATDTLNQLRGDALQPKNFNADNDLKIPRGDYRNPEDYYPVQYSLPAAYGVGPDGLPSTATADRRAKAKQLKAYLIVFEQLLGNALAQLAGTADLFSLDPRVANTYFTHMFSESSIGGLSSIAPGMTAAALQQLVETQQEFYGRRNRFLNHLLARFGEDFNEYALLLTNAAGEQVTERRLIEDKIAFLQAYPQISHDRGKAFDRTQDTCSPENFPGIKKRISLLLGYPDLSFEWTVAAHARGKYPLTYQLKDRNGRKWFEGKLAVTANSDKEAELAGYRFVIERMIGADTKTYDVPARGGKFRLVLYDSSAQELGNYPDQFDNRSDALDIQQQLMAWSANERMIVVEHLLLRPKFPGDALYPACCEGGCRTCGDEDPYSFRLTFIMPGWVPQYTDNLDLRRFADRTIQQETPSHLLGKTCWVGNDGFVENPCDDVIGDVANLVLSKGLTAANAPPDPDDACACANAIYNAFGTAFSKWYEDKTLDFLRPDALTKIITDEFAAKIKPGDIASTTVLDPALWSEVQILMTNHFVDVAVYGWQFERFENAWCKWLGANAAIDWTQERLLACVQALLETNLLTPPAKESEVCECAKDILTKYGTTFHDWMQANLAAGNALENLTPFVAPPLALCNGMNFRAGTADALGQLLGGRYTAYKEVSYRLWVVLNLLSKLRSVYPGATLHDCDDASDENPVRLDNTALGNYPMRTSLK
jgi:hypothetical protein